MQQVAWQGARGPMGRYQRFAGRVHYEVADEPPLHPYFFFRAEDGIRGRTVTGVQTCALPISILAFAVFQSAQPWLVSLGARSCEQRAILQKMVRLHRLLRQRHSAKSMASFRNKLEFSCEDRKSVV